MNKKIKPQYIILGILIFALVLIMFSCGEDKDKVAYQQPPAYTQNEQMYSQGTPVQNYPQQAPIIVQNHDSGNDHMLTNMLIGAMIYRTLDGRQYSYDSMGRTIDTSGRPMYVKDDYRSTHKDWRRTEAENRALKEKVARQKEELKRQQDANLKKKNEIKSLKANQQPNNYKPAQNKPYNSLGQAKQPVPTSKFSSPTQPKGVQFKQSSPGGYKSGGFSGYKSSGSSFRSSGGGFRR